MDQGEINKKAIEAAESLFNKTTENMGDREKAVFYAMAYINTQNVRVDSICPDAISAMCKELGVSRLEDSFKHTVEEYSEIMLKAMDGQVPDEERDAVKEALDQSYEKAMLQIMFGEIVARAVSAPA